MEKIMSALLSANNLIFDLMLENQQLREKLQKYEEKVMPEMSEYLKSVMKAHKAGENG